MTAGPSRTSTPASQCADLHWPGSFDSEPTGGAGNDGFSGFAGSLAYHGGVLRPIHKVRNDPRVRVMPRTGVLPDVSTHPSATLAPILRLAGHLGLGSGRTSPALGDNG